MNEQELRQQIDYLKGRFAVLEHATLLTVHALPPEAKDAVIKTVELYDVDTVRSQVSGEIKNSE